MIQIINNYCFLTTACISLYLSVQRHFLRSLISACPSPLLISLTETWNINKQWSHLIILELSYTKINNNITYVHDLLHIHTRDKPTTTGCHSYVIGLPIAKSCEAQFPFVQGRSPIFHIVAVAILARLLNRQPTSASCFGYLITSDVWQERRLNITS